MEFSPLTTVFLQDVPGVVTFIATMLGLGVGSMLADYIGENRVEGLKRILAAIWMVMVSIVWGILSLLVWGFVLVDLFVLQLVLNREGVSPEEKPAQMIQGYFQWREGMHSYITTKEDSGFSWWPTPGNGR